MALIICDTSGLIAIAECLGNAKKENTLFMRLEEEFGENLTLLFHPISVVELASNTHHEVHFRKFSDANWINKSNQIADKNQSTLIVLGLVDDKSGIGLSKIPKPRKCPIDESYWTHLMSERMSYSSLTCHNGEPRHKLAMADYQIFGLATYLKKKRETAEIGIFTGDHEIITAAVESRIPWLGVYPDNSVRKWKNCAQDNTCYKGDTSLAVAGCYERFHGPDFKI
jgi:hypothetical protein